MRAAIFAIAVSMTAAMPARAEDRTMLPEIVIGAPPASTNVPREPGAPTASGGGGNSTQGRCDGPNGGDRSLGCLNQKLKRQVDQVNPPVQNVAPIDARSSDLKVGVANVPAVQQQYGRNFGISVIPYRPPPPVFSSPIGRR